MSGFRIKKYRLDNNYSQKQLADIFGVSVRTIVRWEQNKTRPNQEEANKVAEIMGISVEELLSDRDEINDSTKQSVLDKISDSVDNLVTGQETINESLLSNRQEDDIRQDKLIRELQEQNEQLIMRIESYEKTLDSNKAILRHKRIQTIVILVTCLIVIGLAVYAYVFWRNHGFNDEIIMGEAELGSASYFTIDDEE